VGEAANAKNTQLFGLAGEAIPAEAMPTVPPLRAPVVASPESLSSVAEPFHSEIPPAASIPAPTGMARIGSGQVPSLTHALSRARLPFSEVPGVVLVDATRALVTTSDERPFAARLEVLRSYGGQVTCTVLLRNLQGRASGEPLGSVGAPMVKVSGAGHLVLGARAGHTILGFRLEDAGLAFVREEHLLGFDMMLAYENGRLSTGDRQMSHVVQLQGAGIVLLELMGALAAVPVSGARSATVRRDAIVGWIGRLAPRALTPAEAPAGQHGLVTFGGEGTLLTVV
jgi:uncharacterized protein (AIM24 family)